MLKAHTASLIHALALIGLGGYGYLSSDTPSVTALIPVVFGVLLLAMNRGVKNENKVIAHVAVLLAVTTTTDRNSPARDFIFMISFLDSALSMNEVSTYYILCTR